MTMEPPNTGPEEENQDARQRLIRHLIEAGLITEDDQRARQQLLDLMEAEESPEGDEGPIQRHLRQIIDAESNALNQGQHGHVEEVGFPRVYMPEIDSGQRIRILLEDGKMLPLALSPFSAHKKLLKQIGYSFEGRRKCSRNES